MVRRILTLSALVLLVVASVASAATPQAGHFNGPTSQHSGSHGNLSFKALSDKSLKRIAFDWQATCSTPDNPYFEGTTQITSKVPVKHGSFALNAQYPIDPGGGSTAQASVTMSGHFRKAGKAAGWFTVDVAVFNAQGTQTDSCQTGTISWTATHK